MAEEHWAMWSFAQRWVTSRNLRASRKYNNNGSVQLMDVTTNSFCIHTSRSSFCLLLPSFYFHFFPHSKLVFLFASFVFLTNRLCNCWCECWATSQEANYPFDRDKERKAGLRNSAGDSQSADKIRTKKSECSDDCHVATGRLGRATMASLLAQVIKFMCSRPLTSICMLAEESNVRIHVFCASCSDSSIIFSVLCLLGYRMLQMGAKRLFPTQAVPGCVSELCHAWQQSNSRFNEFNDLRQCSRNWVELE